MKRIGLMSDTHSHLDKKIFKYFEECDEIWHAGDIGTAKLALELEAFKPFRAVYGNIDGHELRSMYPLDLRFNCEGLDVWMTHIGGYPGRYNKRVRETIRNNPTWTFYYGAFPYPQSHARQKIRLVAYESWCLWNCWFS